jgi:dTDP-4-dehydrorhamnose reductase
VFGLSHRELDILDRGAVAEALSRVDAPIVVNAAAYTAVDAAESDPAGAFRANRDGAGWLADACARQGRTLIHLSTDYVFDGAKEEPYRIDDRVAPLNVYGASKAAGETLVRCASPAHVVLRTAWVHAPWGRNFVRSVIERVRSGERLRVVYDQRGSPTAADEVARAILLLAERLPDPALGGVHHWAGRGVATWYDVAKVAAQALRAAGGPAAALERIATADRPTAARRPAYSALDCSELAGLLGAEPDAWRSGVAASARGLLFGGDARELEMIS